PVRQSLPDEALLKWIGDGATLEAMGQLEREMSLRQRDAVAFSAWEQSMVALGTAEELDALGHARAGFSDVMDPTIGSIPSIPPAAHQAVSEQKPVEELTPDQQPLDELAPEPVSFDRGGAAVLNEEQLADLALAPAPSSLPYA